MEPLGRIPIDVMGDYQYDSADKSDSTNSEYQYRNFNNRFQVCLSEPGTLKIKMYKPTYSSGNK